MTALLRASAVMACAWMVLVGAAAAQTSDRLEAFLEATGFDVALESLRLTAESAPAMLGLEADDFGLQWTALVEEVFETEEMHDMAIEILSETLDDDLLTHAVDFYMSDLGQRLVVAENASHMHEDETLKSESGEAIVSGLVRIGSPRVEELKRMNAAVGSVDMTIRAIHEVQLRFLLAASDAGVIELRMEEDDLRESLLSNEGDLRRSLQVSGLSSSAYTYQAFSDEEISAYADALEHPKMRRVYELMNAVQWDIMANRYEQVALGLSKLRPSQEL
ncbi:MAG: DUF2059 domain-containing protein [Pseudomonadota bacterium]